MIFRSLYTIYLCRRDKDKERDDLKKSTEQICVRDWRRVSPFRGICLSRKARPPLGGNAQMNITQGDMQQAFIYSSFSLYKVSFSSISPFALLHPILLGRLRIVHVPFADSIQEGCCRYSRHPHTLFRP